MPKSPVLAIGSVAILAFATPGTCQEPSAEFVRSYLWPRDAEELGVAQERLADDSMQDLSRLAMLSVEEWMRNGRPGLEGVAPELDGTLPVQTLAVRAPTGVTIPVQVRLPRDYDPARQWPLMLAMHGGPTATAAQARSGAGRMLAVWAKAADDAGWIVAAPAMESTCSQGEYTRERLPFEVFHPEEAAAVVAAVRARFAVNPDRVVSTGISLGSNFSIAFACARPDWLSAIVPVSTEGDSRELLLRNMRGVPIYVLEGSQDRNIRGIGGPRALQEILVALGQDVHYREFSDRSHEGFGDHYGDVLRWLDSRPRRRDPHLVLRVPHGAIMPVARRVHWIESDTRQGLIRARVVDPGRIEIEVHRASELRLFLNDHLVDLDRPLEVVVNGETVHDGLLSRSVRVALEQARELNDERRFYCAELTVTVPNSDTARSVGRRLAEELAPSREPGTLSFWEMYAARAILERFPDLGFTATPVDSPPALGNAGERVGLHVDSVDPDGPLAASGLLARDLLLEFDGEPFFTGDGGVAGIRAWLVRELRSEPAEYELTVMRGDEQLVLSASLGLGPYREPQQDLSDDEFED